MAVGRLSVMSVRKVMERVALGIATSEGHPSVGTTLVKERIEYQYYGEAGVRYRRSLELTFACPQHLRVLASRG
jgi:hypothetical protein